MAASQSRYLFLSHRNSDITGRLNKLAAEKMSLTRDMQAVSRKYNEALNSKVYKWTNNGGASYIDVSYSTLMSPSVLNQDKVYLLTNASGKVVIDAKYKEYAEMLSPDGKGGVSWENNPKRFEILSELTGMSTTTLSQLTPALEARYTAEVAVNKAKSKEPNIEKYQVRSDNANEELAVKAGLKGNPAKMSQPELMGELCKLAVFMGSQSNKELIGECIEDYMAGYNKDEVTDWNNVLRTLAGAYQSKGGEVSVNKEGNMNLVWYREGQYEAYENAYDEWKSNTMDPAQENLDDAINNYSKLYTSEEESLIQFYDTLFSSIAEKGWTYNSEVNDNEYLNNMLQNNVYTITTVDRSNNYDYQKGKCIPNNEYDTNIASNFPNLIQINDNDAREKAYNDYQSEKARINSKESSLDVRIKNLTTEQEAINTMLDGIKAIINKNVETNFNLFG